MKVFSRLMGGFFCIRPMLYLSAIGLLVTSSVAVGKTIYIDEIRYTNCSDGTSVYDVSSFWVKSKRPNGTTKEDYVYKPTMQTQTTCFNLDKSNVDEGAEVWLSYLISLGDKEGCRKDNTKYYYKEGANNIAYYHSEGSTLQNNRCRIGMGKCFRDACKFRPLDGD